MDMELAFVLSFLLYLFLLVRNNTTKKRVHNEATQELYAVVERTLGKDTLKTLQSHKIWVGMPEPLIYYAFGTPDDIGERSTANDVFKTWYYNPIPNARSNARRKYYIEVYSKNGFIANWDMLS